MRNDTVAVLVTASLIATAAPVRAATIKLTHREYAPTFSPSLKQAYQGTRVYFRTFTNDAEDTGLWSYGSETKQASYKIQDNRLNYYLLYCFHTAARSLGMIVYENESGDPNLREVDLVFTSWSHERFRAELSVYRGGVKVVDRTLNVEFEAARSVLPDALKQRAYDCVTKVFTTIFEDKEVKDAFLGPPVAN